MPRIEMSKLVEKMDLKNLTPDVDLSGIYLEEPEVNRPALQLTGYFDHFDNQRIQIIGFWNGWIRKKRSGSMISFLHVVFRV